MRPSRVEVADDDQQRPERNGPRGGARAYVHDLRSFYRLLGTAAFALAITFTVNYLTNPGRWWFLWVALGFGIAIAFSGLNLLLKGRLFGAAWEERQIRKYLERDSH